MVDLGTLEIGLQLDRATLDRDINAVRSDLAKVGRNIPQINIKPVVDHQPLTNLNKHLDKKVKHLKEVNAYFRNNPVKVIYGSEGDFGSSQVGGGRGANNSVSNNYLSQDDNIVSAIKSLGNDVKGLFKTSIKYESETAKNTKFKIIPNLFKGIFAGFAEKIGGTLASEFVENPTKSISKNIKRSAQHIDKNVIGDDYTYETFFAELIRSGDVKKSYEATLPRTKVGKAKDRLGKLQEIAISPSPKKAMALILKDAELKDILGKVSVEAKTDHPSMGSKELNKVIFDRFLDEAQPKNFVQSAINPLIKEFQHLLRFIQGMQSYNTSVKAQGIYNERKPGFPILKKDENIVNVIGGAQIEKGQGGRKLAVAFQPLSPKDRFIPVENPETDNNPNSEVDKWFDKNFKDWFPDLAKDDNVLNTVKNAYRQVAFSLDPRASSTAAAQSMANIKLAQEQGAKASTVTFSLGGAEGVRLDNLLKFSGIKNAPVMSMAYPFLNFTQNASPNYQSTMLKNDPLSFSHRLGLGFPTPQHKVYETSGVFSTNAHAPHHLMDQPEFLQDFYNTIHREKPNDVTMNNAHEIVKLGNTLYELISIMHQLKSVFTTGEFDLNAPHKAFNKDFAVEGGLGKFGEFGTALTKMERSSSPRLQVMAKALRPQYEETNQLIKQAFKKEGVNLPDGNLAGFFKFNAIAGELNASLKAFKTGVPDSLKGYYSNDLTPKGVSQRLPLIQSEAMSWFRSSGEGKYGKEWNDKILSAFTYVESLAKKFVDQKGVLSAKDREDITLFEKTIDIDSLSGDLKNILSKSLDTTTLPSEEASREFRVPIPKVFKETQSAILAYNKLLAVLTGEMMPIIDAFKVIGHGMSGAVALMTDDLVYKTDLDPDGARKIASENEIEAYNRTKGRYAPLLYHAEQGKALVTEKTKGIPLKNILDKAAEPWQGGTKYLESLRERLAVINKQKPANRDQEAIKWLNAEITRMLPLLEADKDTFNKLALPLYEQVGRLGAALQQMGIVHNDLASGNVFFDGDTISSIDLGNAAPIESTLLDPLFDQLTSIMRAIIDNKFYGLLDTVGTAKAIHSGYKNPLPLPPERVADKSILRMQGDQKGKAIPLGSHTEPFLIQALQQGFPNQSINIKEELNKSRVLSENEKIKQKQQQIELENKKKDGVAKQTEQPLPLFSQQFYTAPLPPKPIDLSNTSPNTIGDQIVKALQSLHEITTAVINADKLVIQGIDDDDIGGSGGIGKGDDPDPNSPIPVDPTAGQSTDQQGIPIKLPVAEKGGSIQRQINNVSAIEVFQKTLALANQTYRNAQRFYGGLQKVLGKTSGIAAPVFHALQTLESGIFDFIPGASTAKNVIKGASPMLLGGSAMQFLPPAVSQTAIGLAQTGVGSLTAMGGSGLSTSIASAISGAFTLLGDAVGAGAIYHGVGKQIQNGVTGLFSQMRLGNAEDYGYIRTIEQIPNDQLPSSQQKTLPANRQALYTIPERLNSIQSVDDFLTHFAKSTAKGQSGRDVTLMVAKNLQTLLTQLRVSYRDVEGNNPQAVKKLNPNELGDAFRKYQVWQLLETMMSMNPKTLYNNKLAEPPSGVAPIDPSNWLVKVDSNPNIAKQESIGAWGKIQDKRKSGDAVYEEVVAFVEHLKQLQARIGGVGGRIGQSLSGIYSQAIQLQKELKAQENNFQQLNQLPVSTTPSSNPSRDKFLIANVKASANGGKISEQIGRDLVSGTIKGIKQEASKLPQVVKEEITDPTIKATQEGFETHSPSKVFMDIGADIVKGLELGLDFSEIKKNIDQDVLDLVPNIGMISGLFSKFGTESLAEQLENEYVASGGNIQKLESRVLGGNLNKSTNLSKCIQPIQETTPLIIAKPPVIAPLPIPPRPPVITTPLPTQSYQPKPQVFATPKVDKSIQNDKFINFDGWYISHRTRQKNFDSILTQGQISISKSTDDFYNKIGQVLIDIFGAKELIYGALRNIDNLGNVKNTGYGAVELIIDPHEIKDNTTWLDRDSGIYIERTGAKTGSEYQHSLKQMGSLGVQHLSKMFPDPSTVKNIENSFGYIETQTKQNIPLKAVKGVYAERSIIPQSTIKTPNIEIPVLRSITEIRSLVKNINDGFKGIDLATSLEQSAKEGLSATKKVFKINSPSLVFMEIGRNIVKGLELGLNFSQLKGLIPKQIQSILGKDVVDKLVSNLIDANKIKTNLAIKNNHPVSQPSALKQVSKELSFNFASELERYHDFFAGQKLRPTQNDEWGKKIDFIHNNNGGGVSALIEGTFKRGWKQSEGLYRGQEKDFLSRNQFKGAKFIKKVLRLGSEFNYAPPIYTAPTLLLPDNSYIGNSDLYGNVGVQFSKRQDKDWAGKHFGDSGLISDYITLMPRLSDGAIDFKRLYDFYLKKSYTNKKGELHGFPIYGEAQWYGKDNPEIEKIVYRGIETDTSSNVSRQHYSEKEYPAIGAYSVMKAQLLGYDTFYQRPATSEINKEAAKRPKFSWVDLFDYTPAKQVKLPSYMLGNMAGGASYEEALKQYSSFLGGQKYKGQFEKAMGLPYTPRPEGTYGYRQGEIPLLGSTLRQPHPMMMTGHERRRTALPSLTANNWQDNLNMPLSGKGINVIDALSKEITRDLSKVKKAGGDIARAISDGFDEPLQINSPSKLFQYFGRMIIEGLSLGLGNNQKPIGILDKLTNDLKLRFLKFAVNSAKHKESGMVDFPEDLWGDDTAQPPQKTKPTNLGRLGKIKQRLSTIFNAEDYTEYDQALEYGDLDKALAMLNIKEFFVKDEFEEKKDYVKNLKATNNQNNNKAVSVPVVSKPVTPVTPPEQPVVSSKGKRKHEYIPFPTASYDNNNAPSTLPNKTAIGLSAHTGKKFATMERVLAESLGKLDFEKAIKILRVLVQIDKGYAEELAEVQKYQAKVFVKKEVARLNQSLGQAIANQDFDEAIKVLQKLAEFDDKYIADLKKLEAYIQSIKIDPIVGNEVSGSTDTGQQTQGKGQKKRANKKKNKAKKQRRDLRSQDSDLDDYMSFSVEELEELRTPENEEAINYAINQKKQNNPRPRRHNPTNPIMSGVPSPTQSYGPQRVITPPLSKLQKLHLAMDQAFEAGNIDKAIAILRRMAQLDKKYVADLNKALEAKSRLNLINSSTPSNGGVNNNGGTTPTGGGSGSGKPPIPSTTTPTGGGSGSGKPPIPPTTTPTSGGKDDEKGKSTGGYGGVRNATSIEGSGMHNVKPRTFNGKPIEGTNMGVGFDVHGSGQVLMDWFKQFTKSGQSKATWKTFENGSKAVEDFAVNTANSVPSLGNIYKGFADVFNLIRQESPQAGRALNFFKDITISAFGTAGIWSFREAISAVMRDTTKAFLSMEQIELGVRFTEGNNAKDKVKELRQQSRDVGVDFETVGRGYSKLAIASKDTAIEPQLDFVFKGFLQSFKTRQVNPEAQGRALLALEQMISKEKISAEELRLQLSEAIPGAMGVGARAMGMSGLELADLLQSGQLTAPQFLPRFSAQLQLESSALMPFTEGSLQGSINKMQGEVFEGQALIGETLIPISQGAINGLTKALEILNKSADVVKAALLGLGIKLVGMLVPAFSNVMVNSGGMTIVMRLLGFEYSRVTKTAITSASATAVATRAEELYNKAKASGIAISMASANKIATGQLQREGQVQTVASGGIAKGMIGLGASVLTTTAQFIAVGMAINLFIKALQGITGSYNQDIKQTTKALGEILKKMGKTPADADEEQKKEDRKIINMQRYAGTVGGILGGTAAVAASPFTGGTSLTQIGTAGAIGSFIADQGVKMLTGKAVITDKNTHQKTVVNGDLVGFGKAQDYSKQVDKLNTDTTAFVEGVNNILTSDKLQGINDQLTKFDSTDNKKKAEIIAEKNKPSPDFAQINELNVEISKNAQERAKFVETNLVNVVAVGGVKEGLETQIKTLKDDKNPNIERDQRAILGNTEYERKLLGLESNLSLVQTAIDNLNLALKTSENLLRQVVFGFGNINRGLANNKFKDVLKTGEESNLVKQQRASGQIGQYSYDQQLNQVQQGGSERNLGFVTNAIRDMEGKFQEFNGNENQQLGLKLQSFGYNQGESLLNFFKRQSPDTLGMVTQEMGDIGNQDDLLPAEKKLVEQAQRYLGLLQEQVTIKGQGLDLEIQNRQLERDRRLSLRDFGRREVDLAMQIDNAVRQRAIELRNLLRQQDDQVNQNRVAVRNILQSYVDLNIQVNRRAIELKNNLDQVKRNIERMELGLKLNQLANPGDGLFNGFIDIVDRVAQTFDNYKNEEGNINLQALDAEQQRLQVARQVRDLQEQIYNYELQRLRQAEDLMTAHENFIKTQAQSWLQIQRTIEDMETQAQQMGVSFEGIAYTLEAMNQLYGKLYMGLANMAISVGGGNGVSSMVMQGGGGSSQTMGMSLQGGSNGMLPPPPNTNFYGNGMMSSVDSNQNTTWSNFPTAQQVLGIGSQLSLNGVRSIVVNGKDVRLNGNTNTNNTTPINRTTGSGSSNYGVASNKKQPHNLQTPRSSREAQTQVIYPVTPNVDKNGKVQKASLEEQRHRAILLTTGDQDYIGGIPILSNQAIRKDNTYEQRIIAQDNLKKIDDAIRTGQIIVKLDPKTDKILSFVTTTGVASSLLSNRRYNSPMEFKGNDFSEAIKFIGTQKQRIQNPSTIPDWASYFDNYQYHEGDRYLPKEKRVDTSRRVDGKSIPAFEPYKSNWVVPKPPVKDKKVSSSLMDDGLLMAMGGMSNVMSDMGVFNMGLMAQSQRRNLSVLEKAKEQQIVEQKKIKELGEQINNNVVIPAKSNELVDPRILSQPVPLMPLDFDRVNKKEAQNAETAKELTGARFNESVVKLGSELRRLVNEVVNLTRRLQDEAKTMKRGMIADAFSVEEMMFNAKGGFVTPNEQGNMARKRADMETTNKINEFADKIINTERQVNVTKDGIGRTTSEVINLFKKNNLTPPENLDTNGLISWAKSNNTMSGESGKLLGEMLKTLEAYSNIVELAPQFISTLNGLSRELEGNRETKNSLAERQAKIQETKNLFSGIAGMNDMIGNAMIQRRGVDYQEGFSYKRSGAIATLAAEKEEMLNPDKVARDVRAYNEIYSNNPITEERYKGNLQKGFENKRQQIMFDTSGYNEMKAEFGQMADMMNSIGGQLNQRGDLLRGNWLNNSGQAIQTKIQTGDMRLELKRLFESGRLGDINLAPTQAKFNSLNKSIDEFEKNALAKMMVDNNFIVSGLVEPMKTAINGFATIFIDESKTFWQKVNDIATNFLTGIANHFANNFSTAVTTWLSEKLANLIGVGLDSGTDALNIASATSLQNAGITLGGASFNLQESARSQNIAAWELAQAAAKLNASVGGGGEATSKGGGILSSVLGAFMQPIASLAFGGIAPDTGALSGNLGVGAGLPSTNDFTTGFTAGGAYGIDSATNIQGWGNYAKGGLVDIENYAKGGIVEQAQRALAKERLLGGGKAILSALTVGEYVVPKNPNKKDIANLYANVPMARNMQIENYARGGMVGKANSLSGVVTNNSRMEKSDNSFVSNIYIKTNDAVSFGKTRYQLEMEENARLSRASRRFS